MSNLESRNNELVFSFPEVHPSATCHVEFQRTLRLPDDGKTYPLPPGLGKFPLVEVDSHKDRVSDDMKTRGGVILPMYQSEALWIKFHADRDADRGVPYPFALKISAGKRSAVTGNAWSTELVEGDYVVIPVQPWLDGFMLSAGTIRQFVAAPLGAGYTVEEQLTGKAEFGGIQLEAIPMSVTEFEKRFPVRPRPIARATAASYGMKSFGGDGSKGFGGAELDVLYESDMPRSLESTPRARRATLSVASMGMAAGGRMTQKIEVDPYGLQVWDQSHTRRVFVHLLNSLSWREVTGHEPPTTPRTAADYARYSLPWFEHYSDGPSLGATANTDKIKGVAQLEAEKGGIPLTTGNASVDLAGSPKVAIHAPPVNTGVKDGNW